MGSLDPSTAKTRSTANVPAAVLEPSASSHTFQPRYCSRSRLRSALRSTHHETLPAAIDQLPASTPLFGVALEVSAQPARPASGSCLQRPTQAVFGSRDTCRALLVCPRSQFRSQQNPSIPVNYGPAPFKRRYRKCSGVLTCTAPHHSRARPLPMNANGFWTTPR
jgi:hypothetical protein